MIIPINTAAVWISRYIAKNEELLKRNIVMYTMFHDMARKNIMIYFMDVAQPLRTHFPSKATCCVCFGLWCLCTHLPQLIRPLMHEQKCLSFY